jgi:hypothetical protein
LLALSIGGEVSQVEIKVQGSTWLVKPPFHPNVDALSNRVHRVCPTSFRPPLFPFDSSISKVRAERFHCEIVTIFLASCQIEHTEMSSANLFKFLAGITTLLAITLAFAWMFRDAEQAATRLAYLPLEAKRNKETHSIKLRSCKKI